MEMNLSVMCSGNVSGQFTITQYNNDVFISTLIPSFIYTCCLLVIGIPGNALVCYIYQLKIRKKQLSTDIFILSLSWFDLINCLVSLPVEIKLILNYVQFDNPVVCKVHRFLTFFGNNASSVVLLAIAINRLVAFLSGPVRRRLKPRMAKGIVALALCISGCVSWPMLLFFGTHTLPLPNGIVTHRCSITNEYAHHQSVVIFVVALLCFHILFDLLFLIIYSIIGKQICHDISIISSTYEHRSDICRQSVSSRESMVIVSDNLSKSQSRSPLRMRINLQPRENKHNSKMIAANHDSVEQTETSFIFTNKCTRRQGNDSNGTMQHQSKHTGNRTSSKLSENTIFTRRATASKTSLMLFIVTVAYALSFLPYCIIIVIRRVAGPTYYNGLNNTEKSLYQLFLRSYLLSSAINPIIYSFVNISFRKRCRKALCDIVCCLKCSRTKQQGNL